MRPYAVFWFDQGIAHGQEFDTFDLMLSYAEGLRNSNQIAITHVTISIDHPDHVSSGVSQPPADYNWPKRRVEAVGRPSRRGDDDE